MRSILLVALLMTVCGLVQAEWRELSPMPTPRSETVAVHLHGRIYVPGGLGGMRSLEAYDIASDSWQALAPLPAGRHHLMAAALSGKLYVFGGADQSWQASATAWVYEPAADTWASLPAMPEPRYAGAAVALGNYLFVVGGEGPSGRVLRYDPVDNVWQRLGASRERREHVAAAAMGTRIYLIGGRYRGVGELASVEVYHPTRDRWTRGPGLRTARAGFAAVYTPRVIHVFGGEVIMNGRHTLTSGEILEAEATQWTAGRGLPVPLHGVPVAAVGDAIFVLGGSSAAGAIENHGRVFRWTP
jgi:N-acetylneuraminic acid mutarotase